MFRDLLGAFTGLFTERRSRLEVAALLLTMAMLPVTELLVTRMFSQLVLHGAERLETGRTALLLAGAGFFAAFALSRALHHVVRLNRVRVFRRGFESSQTARPRHQEAWSWASAFELSTASVALIQVVAFCLLFVWLDPLFGVVNIGIGAAVLALVAVIYRRQLARQLAYLAEGRDTATGVGERVGRRLRDAELGAVLASLAMALALALVLLRAVTGSIAGADAIVLFIGLRMMYSQVGHLSASAMRFARVEARLTAGGRGGDADPDPDDETDGDDEEDADDEAARAEFDLPPANPTPHRARLVRQMLQAGQGGDLPQVEAYAARLRATARPRQQELDDQEGAEAFAHLAAPAERAGALPVLWWPRPFPGTADNWLAPLLVRRVGGHPVTYQKPAVATERPHLLVSGSVLSHAQRSSVVVGAGVAWPDERPAPDAHYLGVRGPLSAEALRRAGGPVVTAYGDPLVLAGRLLALPRPAPHGRLALLRHVSQSRLTLTLPDGVDEVSTRVSRPDDVTELLTDLTAYDGVVTSDPGVLALCLALALPCATVALEPRDDLAHVVRDLALGLGLDEPVVHPLGPDLRRTDLESLLETRVVDAAVLDAVQRRLEDAVELVARDVPADLPA
ncbi:hypothetical protein ASG49_06405 [Marmoricola sp. Leaf446]|uniref:hypothetical protein n=1 Tax=Marmoricola sp. Leaf446 TaxID=1736379 RepID=UPI0006FFBF6B|nr:hypothetical protein [Marmoricola sp. Leaf446]KQT94495.1 hypothetical protein ASG49_06405 [Marmoricola sp. Leaf446]